MKTKTTEPVKRSRSKLTWLLGVTAVVFVLLYWEQTGLLYVLATLAMCVLFIVVAFADLETGHNEIDGKEFVEAGKRA